MKKEIFNSPKFNELYLTLDGRKATFIESNREKNTYWLIPENTGGNLYEYNVNGSLVGSCMEEDPLNIISKYTEKKNISNKKKDSLSLYNIEDIKKYIESYNHKIPYTLNIVNYKEYNEFCRNSYNEDEIINQYNKDSCIVILFNYGQYYKFNKIMNDLKKLADDIVQTIYNEKGNYYENIDYSLYHNFGAPSLYGIDYGITGIKKHNLNNEKKNTLYINMFEIRISLNEDLREIFHNKIKKA